MIFFAEILQLDVKYFGYFVEAGVSDAFIVLDSQQKRVAKYAKSNDTDTLCILDQNSSR